MTIQRTRDRILANSGLGSLLMAACSLAACESDVGEGSTTLPYASGGGDQTKASPSTIPSSNFGLSLPADAGVNQAASKSSAGAGASAKNTNAAATPKRGAGGSDAAGAPVTAPAGAASSACESTAEAVEVVLTTYCASCHGPSSPSEGGFNTVLNVPALLTSGRVVPNEADMSPIYKRILGGSMPPAKVTTRPGATDISAVKDWIDCGAPDWAKAGTQLAFLDINTRLETVLDDLEAVPNPVDRERMRYFDVSTLANAGTSEEQLQVYREAVSMLMNSLSLGRTVIAPQAVDRTGLIYRVDLRDYGWDASTWNQLEAVYPYAVIYDENSRLYPFDEGRAQDIREETKTNIPIIQADWFLSHASRPPLYYSLLKLPRSLPALEQQLGVDIQRNIDTEQVVRAGFAIAGPSQNNRVIERHELGGNRGALWISYDFADNLDLKDIFAHPLDFQENGSELIFNLDNGLQGYFVVDAAGERLDKAPNNVVQDPAARDGAVEAGLSCMNCHQEDGQLPHYDEIRDFELKAGAKVQDVEKVLALYGDQAQLEAVFDADQNRYRTARNELGVKSLTNLTMHVLNDAHLGVLDLNTVASVLGIPSNDLQRSIDASPQTLPPEIVTLRTKGGGIQRDSFESVLNDLIKGLGLGKQLLVRKSNNQPANSTNTNTNTNTNTKTTPPVPGQPGSNPNTNTNKPPTIPDAGMH